ncbi:hypothetical protein BJX65DRAFT_317968 [Aspergillus insuetus]
MSFQLSLELTNIIGPVAKSALRLASLGTLQDINRSGSDGLTELRLASLLGQNRVAEYMRENFRNIVAQSRQHSFPALLEAVGQLVLEAGAGPTVRQAITNPNPAWLSMVVQVSMLAFAHEVQSLAQAVTAVTAEGHRGDTGESAFNYVSALGVINACQEKTAEFPWVGFFERTEEQICKSIIGNASQRRLKRERKRRIDATARSAAIERAKDRSLPFPILKTLVVHLVSIQDLPEHRNLHLRTNRGLSTIVVWCHYVLGIGVSVEIGGSTVVFGDNPRIFVEDCGIYPASATVLDALEEHEPLFQLSQAEEDPVLEGEDRALARGFLKQALRRSGVSEANILVQANWAAASCMNLLSSSREPEFGPLRVTSMTSQVRDNISNSISFLIDIPTRDLSKVKLGKKCPNTGKVSWSSIMVTITLSPKAFSKVDSHKYSLGMQESHPIGSIPDTMDCFDIISRLLLGSQYSEDYVANSVLISACGWSIFLDSLAAVDVSGISPGVMHVQLGVPSRNGERKARIVDGPTDVPMAYGEVLDDTEIPIIFWPGISTSRLSATLIGYHGRDAFSAVQVYQWDADGTRNETRKWRLGLRDKQDMSLKFSIVSDCPCEGYYDAQCDAERIDQLVRAGKVDREDGQGYSRVMQRYSRTRVSSSERVFTTDMEPSTGSVSPPEQGWLFFVTENAAARWLALDGLDQLNGNDAGFRGVVRGNNCCVQCACRTISDRNFVLL